MDTATTAERPKVDVEQLYRWAGVALVAAFPLQIAGFALHPPGEGVEHVTSSSYGPAHVVLFWSWVLVVLGLPALYAKQAVRAGRVGVVGFALSMVAASYHLFLTLYEGYAVPALAAEPQTRALLGPDGPLSHGAGALGPLAPLFLVGFPLLGVATLRAGVFPAAAAWLQIAAIPTFIALAIGLGVALDAVVGPDGESWLGGMLPIAAQYWVLFAGYGVAGLALRRTSPRRDLVAASVAVMPGRAEPSGSGLAR